VLLLHSATNYASIWQINLELCEPSYFIEDHEIIKLGADTLQVILAPGHSPGSICFYSAEQNFIIAGDVLFRESIGRTDLPGGSMQVLLRSITERLYTLPDETIVYSGHGASTTIGYEKQNNLFVRG